MGFERQECGENWKNAGDELWRGPWDSASRIKAPGALVPLAVVPDTGYVQRHGRSWRFDAPLRCVRVPRMNDADALDLLRAAVPAADGEAWADLGAGTGVFTRALAALVGPAGRVIAMDRDARALEALRRSAEGSAAIDVVVGDVARPVALPPLDGAVMANVLHFVADAADVVSRVAALLKPGGRLVLIEYEGRRPSRWVPHPVDSARFMELAAGAGFTPPRIVARRPSLFGGEIYVAVAGRARSR